MRKLVRLGASAAVFFTLSSFSPVSKPPPGTFTAEVRIEKNPRPRAPSSVLPSLSEPDSTIVERPEVNPEKGIECILETLVPRHSTGRFAFFLNWNVDEILNLNGCPSLRDISWTMREYPFSDQTRNAAAGFLSNIDLFIAWKGTSFLTHEDSPLMAILELATNRHNTHAIRMMRKFVQDSYANDSPVNPVSFALGQFISTSAKNVDEELLRQTLVEFFLAMYPNPTADEFSSHGCATSVIKGTSRRDCLGILEGTAKSGPQPVCVVWPFN